MKGYPIEAFQALLRMTIILFSSFVELIEAILQVHHTPVVFSETPLNV
jgi:hypothetical protein